MIRVSPHSRRAVGTLASSDGGFVARSGRFRFVGRSIRWLVRRTNAALHASSDVRYAACFVGRRLL